MWVETRPLWHPTTYQHIICLWPCYLIYTRALMSLYWQMSNPYSSTKSLLAVHGPQVHFHLRTRGGISLNLKEWFLGLRVNEGHRFSWVGPLSSKITTKENEWARWLGIHGPTKSHEACWQFATSVPHGTFLFVRLVHLLADIIIWIPLPPV